MKVFLFALAALSICGAYAAVPAVRDDGPQCKAPNGGGLEPVIKEFVDLLPKEEILGVFLNALSNDAEVQAVFAYLESAEFNDLVKTILETKETKELTRLVCTECYLDTAYYWNKFAPLLGLPPMERSRIAHLRIASRARPGFVGLFEDILDLVPTETFKAMIEEKLKSDEYVKKALEIMQSDTTKDLVLTIREHPAYAHVFESLDKMGVDTVKLREVVGKILGLNGLIF